MWEKPRHVLGTFFFFGIGREWKKVCVCVVACVWVWEIVQIQGPSFPMHDPSSGMIFWVSPMQESELLRESWKETFFVDNEPRNVYYKPHQTALEWTVRWFWETIFLKCYSASSSEELSWNCLSRFVALVAFCLVPKLFQTSTTYTVTHIIPTRVFTETQSLTFTPFSLSLTLFLSHTHPHTHPFNIKLHMESVHCVHI